MIVRINGVELAPTFPQVDIIETYDLQRKAEQFAKKFGTIVIPASVMSGVLSMTTHALAAKDVTTAFWPLLGKIQDLALPIGIGVSLWGLIEYMVGNPGGKTKLKVALISYIGMYIIPLLFQGVHDAFSGMTLK